MDLAVQCSNELRRLARDRRFAPRAEDLVSLADEIADESAAQSWSGVDMHGAFPPDSTIDVGQRNLGEQAIGVVAAVSVFAPVAWIWYSLRKASAAYLNMHLAHDEPSDTFLSLWITGFDGRLSQMHRLVTVTGVSVALIVLAGCFIVASRLTVTARERRETLAEGDLIKCLSTAQRVFWLRRSDDPSETDAVVRSSVRELLRAHEATREASQELTAAAITTKDSLGVLLASAQEATTRAAEAAATSESATSTLATTLNRIDSAILEALRALSSEISSSVEELRLALAAAISGTGSTARSAVDRLTVSIDRVDEAHRAVAASISDVGSTSRNTGSEVVKALDEFGTVMRDVEGSLARHESAMQGQASELTAARDAAERMLRHLERLVSDGDGGRAPSN